MTVKDITQIIFNVPSYQLKDIEKVIKEHYKQVEAISYTVYDSSSILVLHNIENNVYTTITKNVYTITIKNTTKKLTTINIKQTNSN